MPNIVQATRVLGIAVTTASMCLAHGTAPASRQPSGEGKGEQVVRTFLGGGRFAFSPDGRWLAASGELGNAKLFEVATGQLVQRMPHKSLAVVNFAFSADSKYVVSGSQVDGSAVVWEIGSGAKVGTFEGLSKQNPKTYEYSKECMLSGDGELVAIAHNASIYKWPAKNAKVEIWDVATGRRLQTVELWEQRVSWMVFSPDDTLLLVSLIGADKSLWDVKTGKLVRRIPVTFGGNFRFSPDGRYWAVTRREGIVICDAATGRELRIAPFLTDAVVDGLAFSQDGQHIALGSAGTVEIYDVASGKLTHLLGKRAPEMTWVAFSPDGRYLASGPHKGDGIRLWDLQVPSNTVPQ
jgi:WD40 repeat protein